MVGFLRADAPLVEQVHGVALDVAAVEGVDRDHRDLGVRFFVDLSGDILNLSLGCRIEDMGKFGYTSVLFPELPDTTDSKQTPSTPRHWAVMH